MTNLVTVMKDMAIITILTTITALTTITTLTTKIGIATIFLSKVFGKVWPRRQCINRHVDCLSIDDIPNNSNPSIHVIQIMLNSLCLSHFRNGSKT
jgi:hypothetical protein